MIEYRWPDYVMVNKDEDEVDDYEDKADGKDLANTCKVLYCILVPRYLCF